MITMTMEKLFAKAGLNYNEMDKNVAYDVSDKNIKIKSFNHKTNKNEFKKILSLVRKDDTTMYQLVSKDGTVFLKCSGAHKIYDKHKKQYFPVEQIEEGTLLSNNGSSIPFFVKKTNEIVPILDMEVEDNSNYFTNGILSHNTTTGGNSLQYYASIRLKVTKIGVVEEGSGDNKEKTSITTRVEAVKNKTFPPFRRGEIQVAFGKGIDNEAGVLEELIEKGIIQKKGGWYAYEGTNVAQGIMNLKIWISQHQDEYQNMKQRLDEMDKQTIEEMPAENVSEESLPDEDNTETGEIE